MGDNIVPEKNADPARTGKTPHALTVTEQRQFTEIVAQATLALNESLDMDTVLDRIFEQARRIIPFKNATISLFNEETWHRVRVWGFEDQSKVQKLYQQTYLPKFRPNKRNGAFGRLGLAQTIR